MHSFFSFLAQGSVLLPTVTKPSGRKNAAGGAGEMGCFQGVVVAQF
jgi:hypothetical protein